MEKINKAIKKTALLILLLQLCVFASAQNRTDYTPRDRDDWDISSPEAEGLDPRAVDRLYEEAAEMDYLYSILILKNGKLVAEQYFNGASIDYISNIQSATKSITSALMGIAIEEGAVGSVDDKMIDYFPEYRNRLRDYRKADITVEQLLQHRAGYPWEESAAEYFETLMSGDYLPAIVGFPLVDKPGTACHYSNLSSHWAGVIVSRGTGSSLKNYGIEHLFNPLGMTVGTWHRDADYYNAGLGGLYTNARSLLKFGQLYLNDGVYNGQRILSEQWVEDSLRSYSENAWITRRIGRYFRDIGYGYQWWSATCGSTSFNFAWGHGGQLIILIEELDMVIVTTSDPFYRQHDGESWKHEKAVFNLIGRYISGLR